ncbi:hypothetical protein AHAS_Ahas19G0100600 [Arachis hypogaea]
MKEQLQQSQQEAHEEALSKQTHHVSPPNVHPLVQALKAGIIMVANVALKDDFGAPSFSFGFSQSSEEATVTQEDKPPVKLENFQESPGLVEELEQLVEVMNTRVAAALKYAKEQSPH